MQTTLPPQPTFQRHGFSRASAYLPKAYVVQTQINKTADIEELWRELKRNGCKKLRNTLTEHFLPLVRVTAERMHSKLPSHVEVDELIQAGVFGLMDAIDGYDPERGVKFEYYAKQRIHGAILDDLRAQDFAPRLVRSHSHAVDRAVKELEAEHGCMPEPEQIARRLGITTEELDRWMREINMANMISLDRASNEYDGDGKEVRKVDTIEDSGIPEPTHDMERRELIELATRGLGNKEKLILVLYYLEELTMKEIGLVLNLSESRVCQIHNHIRDRLRTQLECQRETLMG